MPSPFPGMDPYREAPYAWPDLHASLIPLIRDVIAPQVAPDYYVRIDRRTYTIELEIRDTRTRALITAIELLSPTNKRAGEGRDLYERKRRHVLLSLTNLVEIDLLRVGQPMETRPSPPSDYRVLVCRGWQGRRAEQFSFDLRDGLPTVPIPVREGEPEAILSLGPILADLYDRARYDLDIDYREAPPEPALSAEDAAWLDALLRSKGLRWEFMGEGETSSSSEAAPLT